MGRRIVVFRVIGVGFFIGVSITAGVFLGHWVDNRLDTSLFWVVGLILGIVVAFYGVYTMLRPFIGNKGDGGNI